MKKLTFLTATALTASIMASAAYAGGDQRTRQIGEENAAYFERMGHKVSSGPVAMNPDYQFAVTPAQRTAMRNAEYFAGAGHKGGTVAPFNYYTDVSQYPFPGSVLSAERGGYVYSTAVKR